MTGTAAQAREAVRVGRAALTATAHDGRSEAMTTARGELWQACQRLSRLADERDEIPVGRFHDVRDAIEAVNAELRKPEPSRLRWWRRVRRTK